MTFLRPRSNHWGRSLLTMLPKPKRIRAMLAYAGSGCSTPLPGAARLGVPHGEPVMGRGQDAIPAARREAATTGLSGGAHAISQ
jgi:hypothetical protein